MPSWLCSPSNADCQTSATSPLSLPHSWISLTVCLLLRENASVSSALRAADNVLGSPTLTATASSGAHHSLGEGEGGSQALWLCICAGSGDRPTAATPISAWSLLRSLASAMVHLTTLAGMLTSLSLCAALGRRHNPVPPLFWPESCTELWAASLAPISALPPSLCPCSLWLARLHRSHFMDLSDVLVC